MSSTWYKKAESGRDFSDSVMRRIVAYMTDIRWQADQALSKLNDEALFPRDASFGDLSDEARDILHYHFNQISTQVMTDV